MPENVRNFYDDLAAAYHLMFEDWDASMARQAAALGPILERECGAPESVRVLDCACGAGTQALIPLCTRLTNALQATEEGVPETTVMDGICDLSSAITCAYLAMGSRESKRMTSISH